MRKSAIAAGFFAALVAVGWGHPAPADVPQYDPQDEWEGLPESEGREEVYYNCVACHSMATIMQQRLSRGFWDRTINRMIDDMGMPEPPEDERDIILDYLDEHFGQEAPR